MLNIWDDRKPYSFVQVQPKSPIYSIQPIYPFLSFIHINPFFFLYYSIPHFISFPNNPFLSFTILLFSIYLLFPFTTFFFLPHPLHSIASLSRFTCFSFLFHLFLSTLFHSYLLISLSLSSLQFPFCLVSVNTLSQSY